MSVMVGSTVSDIVKRWFERSVGAAIVPSDPCAASGPIGLAQHALHDLADGAARQLLAELDGDQPLRLAELGVGPVLHLGLAGRGAVAPDAERHRRFAPLLARDADDGNV